MGRGKKFDQTQIFHFFSAGQDNDPPNIISCPPDTTLVPPSGVTEIAVWWIEPTATDPSQPVSVSQTHRPLDIFPAGVTTVIYRFTDAVGNSDTCQFTITVIGKSKNVVYSGME